MGNKSLRIKMFKIPQKKNRRTQLQKRTLQGVDYYFTAKMQKNHSQVPRLNPTKTE